MIKLNHLHLFKLLIFFCFLLMIKVSSGVSSPEIKYKVKTVMSGLNSPNSVQVLPNGDIYFSEKYTNLIKRLNTNGEITVIAGGGSNTNTMEHEDYDPIEISLVSPSICIHESTNNIYITSEDNRFYLLNATTHRIAIFEQKQVPSCSIDQTNSLLLFTDTQEKQLHRYSLNTALRQNVDMYIKSYLTGCPNGDIFYAGLGNIQRISWPPFEPFTYYGIGQGGGMFCDVYNQVFVGDTDFKAIYKIVGDGAQVIAGKTSGNVGCQENVDSLQCELSQQISSVHVSSKNEIYFTEESNIKKLYPYCPDDRFNVSSDGLSCIPVCFGKYGSEACGGSLRGVCIDPDVCNCSGNYSGNDCSVTSCFGVESTNTSAVCNGNGNCVAPDKCNCRVNSKWGGPKCDIPVCREKLATNPTVCRSRGICQMPNSCKCHNPELFGGFDCEQPKCNGTLSNDESVCNGRGECQLNNICQCQDENLWGGDFCSLPKCSGILSNDSKVCSSKGDCTAPNTCSCRDGFQGDNCQYVKCFGIDSDNVEVCASHGTCTGRNNCTCFEGYGGKSCELLKCFGILQNSEKVCNGKGECENVDKCSCFNGYSGSNCQVTSCFGIENFNSKVCNYGNGTCQMLDYCKCQNESRWFGESCNVTYCFGKKSVDLNVCGSNGNCVNFDTCQCNENFVGDECQMRYLSRMMFSFNSTGDYSGDGSAFLIVNIQDSIFIDSYFNKTVKINLEFLLNNNSYSMIPINLNVLSPNISIQLPYFQSTGSLTAKLTLFYNSTRISSTFETLHSLNVTQPIILQASTSLPIQRVEPSLEKVVTKDDSGIIAIAVAVPVATISLVGIGVGIAVIITILIKKRAADSLSKNLTKASNIDLELSGV